MWGARRSVTRAPTSAKQRTRGPSNAALPCRQRGQRSGAHRAASSSCLASVWPPDAPPRAARSAPLRVAPPHVAHQLRISQRAAPRWAAAAVAASLAQLRCAAAGGAGWAGVGSRRRARARTWDDVSGSALGRPSRERRRRQAQPLRRPPPPSGPAASPAAFAECRQPRCRGGGGQFAWAQYVAGSRVGPPPLRP